VPRDSIGRATINHSIGGKRKSVAKDLSMLDTQTPRRVLQPTEGKLPPMLWLIVARPIESRGTVIPITSGAIIGRQGDIRWDDPRMSRKHASFETIMDEENARESLFTLTPEKDRNGTLINGRRVKGQTVLHENDVIVMGETHFVVKVLF
ncbi:MAG: FHA domain-containing protein, partial [Chloroflexota bacterium]